MSNSRLLLPGLLWLAVALTAALVGGARAALVSLTDDAFYYVVIARHILEHGESALALGYPTNGYHPVWLMVMVAWGALFGLSLLSVNLLDILTVGAGLLLVLRLLPINNLAAGAFYTLAMAYLTAKVALVGMESSLLLPAFVLFTAALLADPAGVARYRPWWLFLTGGLVIGARLDAALFIVPMLALAPLPWRQRLAILIGLAACGLVYLGVNTLAFGQGLPVSGAIKAVGGIGVNSLYAQQVRDSLQLAALRHLNPVLIMWLSLIAALLLVAALGRDPARPGLRAAFIGFALGMALFQGRLLFASGWKIWPWYGYPTLLFALLLIWLIQPRLEHWRLARGVQLALVPLLAYALVPTLHLRPLDAGFPALNRAFLAEHGDRLDGAIVAMGDRAGSFAFFHNGGVYQLEGLTNTTDYLAYVTKHDDLRAHLCAQGITLFVDYEPPLGDYRQARIEIFRDRLALRPRAHVTVHADEQIAAFAEPRLFYNVRYDEGDYYLYAWRLDCARVD